MSCPLLIKKPCDEFVPGWTRKISSMKGLTLEQQKLFMKTSAAGATGEMVSWHEGFQGCGHFFLFSAVSWIMAETDAVRGIKRQRTTRADGGGVREVCWWKWYCRLLCVFNSYLLSFLMKPRFYHQHEVEWIFISHASTELSARSNYTVLWEAARAQLDFPIPDLRCLWGRHLRK